MAAIDHKDRVRVFPDRDPHGEEEHRLAPLRRLQRPEEIPSREYPCARAARLSIVPYLLPLHVYAEEAPPGEGVD